MRQLLASLFLVAALAPGAPATSAVHLTDADAVLTGVTRPATGSLYTVATLVDGRPVRWDPCRTVHWRFRTNGAPAGALTVVTQAVARVARATGTHWAYDGTTTTAPTSRWLPTTTADVRPVLVGWTDGGTSDLLRGQAAGVLGVTRTAWFGTTRDGRTTAALRAAVVALDRTDRLPLTGPVSWRTVLLHELAHAAGLSHAGSSRQLMYPVLQPALSDLQTGDLAGLAKVGAAGGCLS